MKMKPKTRQILLLAGAVLLAAGCGKQPLAGLFAERNGEPVVFGAAAHTRPLTRTDYASYNDAGDHQDINWLATDQIRIYSPDAARRVAVEQGETDPSKLYHWADYLVVPDEDDPTRGTIKNLSNDGEGPYYDPTQVDYEVGNGLAWVRGQESTEHTFYAVYPRLRQGIDADEGLGLSVTGENVNANNLQGVSGKFPLWINNQQFFSEKGNLAEYGFMTATAKASAGNVQLDFYPAFTAFEINVRSAGEPIGLSSFELISGDKALHGDFVVDYSTGTRKFTSFPADGQNSISVNLTGKSAGTDYLTFTVLALPQEFSNLSVRFTTSQGVSRTLALKYSDSATGAGHTPGANVTFAAGLKHRIFGLALPNGELLISVGTDPWKAGAESDYTTIEDASTFFETYQAYLNGQPLWTDTYVGIAPGFRTVPIDPENPSAGTTDIPTCSTMFTLNTVNVGTALRLVSDNANVGFVYRLPGGAWSAVQDALTIPASTVSTEHPYGNTNTTVYFVVPKTGCPAGAVAHVSLIRVDKNAPVAYTHEMLPGTTDHTKVRFMVLTPEQYASDTETIGNEI